MKNKQIIKHGAAAVVLAMILGISAANAAEVYLQAEQYQKTIPYGSGTGIAPTGPITVVNAGFEDPVLGDTRFTNTVIGWVITGNGGTFNPSAAQITGEAAEGANTHWNSAATLTQVLGDALREGTYTLSVAVGERSDNPATSVFPGYLVQLGVDNGGVFVPLATDDSSVVPSNGFLDSSVSYTAAPGDANLGSPLAIRLVGRPGLQILFDDVRLDGPQSAAVITMWGYSQCSGAGGEFNDLIPCSEPSSPGPQITVPAGDPDGLTVHLRNKLPEATSIMIAGQANAPISDPSMVRTADGRFTSFIDTVATSTVGTTGPITVVNAGFEDPVLGDTQFTNTVIGWVITGNGGTFNPSAAQISGEAAEGANTHWNSAATLTQVLGDTLREGTYTLSVAVGERSDNPVGSVFPGYLVQLGVDNGGVFVPLATDDSSVVPSNGFLDSSVSYTAAPGDANLGSPLAIRLVGRPGLQILFDDVRLEETPTEFATRTYDWPTLRPGSYLYQSGSHVQLQVQMGLYGAIVQDSACTDTTNVQCAYPDVAYDTREVLVFSEIDPALHSPPTPANATMTGYVPRFFLINGEPYSDAAASPSVGVAGDNILLSMINAGLENHAPQLIGGYFDVIAEDGRRAPTRRSQFGTLLPAAKSLDVLFMPAAPGTYTLFDRRLRLVNDTALGGGMLQQIIID